MEKVKIKKIVLIDSGRLSTVLKSCKSNKEVKYLPYNSNNLANLLESERVELLNNGYTHLLISKTEIEPYIVDILLSNDLPIVSPFFSERIEHNSLIQVLDGLHGNIKSFRTFDKLDKDTESVFLNGSVQKVFNSGFGCTLIKSEYLKVVGFRMQKGYLVGDVFANDCFANNIPIYIDTSIQIS